MIADILENGDYITIEKDCVCDGGWWTPFYHQIREIYTRYDKSGKFIYSWWEYVQC